MPDCARDWCRWQACRCDARSRSASPGNHALLPPSPRPRPRWRSCLPQWTRPRGRPRASSPRQGAGGKEAGQRAAPVRCPCDAAPLRCARFPSVQQSQSACLPAHRRRTCAPPSLPTSRSGSPGGRRSSASMSSCRQGGGLDAAWRCWPLGGGAWRRRQQAHAAQCATFCTVPPACTHPRHSLLPVSSSPPGHGRGPAGRHGGVEEGV